MRTKLREGERAVFETRAHWITVVKPFIVLVLAAALSVLSFVLLKEPVSYRPAARWAGGALVLLAFLHFGYREWYRRRDLWVVTNLRVIDEKGIIRLFTKESPLDKINNLSTSQSLLGRILRFGDVEIQTAAEDGATIYRRVAKPRGLKESISHSRDEYGHELDRIHAAEAAPAGGGEAGALRACPSCAEKVKAEAKVCRFCGRDLPPL